MTRLVIVGIGLIGGSIGMAVRRSSLGYEVVGHDLDHSHAGRARKLGAIDRAEWNLPAALDGADLVLLAVPPAAMRQALRDVAPHLPSGCVVTDTASTKASVMGWADETLSDEVSFVGGHPMAGKETHGVDSADPSLFAGCTYCLTPSARAGPEAIERVVGLVRAVGARPFFVDPVEHDSYVAAISHLPFLLSIALARMAGNSPAWRDLARVASSGFRDMTRLASGDPVMHRDICQTNRESILRWVDAFEVELSALAGMIRDDSGADLDEAFQGAKKLRDAWLREREAR